MLNDKVKKIYVDGINGINFINGTVRLNVGTLVPKNSDDPNTEPVFDEEYVIIMPLNSFLNAMNSQQEMINQLEERGVIVRNEDPEQAEGLSQTSVGDTVNPIIP